MKYTEEIKQQLLDLGYTYHEGSHCHIFSPNTIGYFETYIKFETDKDIQILGKVNPISKDASNNNNLDIEFEIYIEDTFDSGSHYSIAKLLLTGEVNISKIDIVARHIYSTLFKQ